MIVEPSRHVPGQPRERVELIAALRCVDAVLLFEHGDAGDPFLDKLVSCAAAGWTGSENYDVLSG